MLYQIGYRVFCPNCASNNHQFHELSCITSFYRPQRSWAMVIFSQASVCPQGGSASVHAGIYLPGADPPGADTPRADPPGPHTPLVADPPRADPPRSRPPMSRHPPGADPPQANSSIRSTSGWYASYWNPFLCQIELIEPI